VEEEITVSKGVYVIRTCLITYNFTESGINVLHLPSNEKPLSRVFRCGRLLRLSVCWRRRITVVAQLLILRCVSHKCVRILSVNLHAFYSTAQNDPLLEQLYIGTHTKFQLLCLYLKYTFFIRPSVDIDHRIIDCSITSCNSVFHETVSTD